MAEEGNVFELDGLEKQLQSLLSRYSSDELRADSKPFCSDYCKLVEEYASRWQVPLPQLRILEVALCYFARASSSFTSNCDHVLHTLSSLALSVFELLLFFDEKDFHQEPLNHFTATFQECHLVLARHQNVHLLQVERLVQAGGAWASSALKAILSESSLPQNQVDGCLSSELPVFFELRVRYLLSCERVSEALALAKHCAHHPAAGQHLFFLQVYLTWLHKTSQHDRLHKEVADLNGKDAVHIICSLECEETDELLLALSRAFLSQQLIRGDMCCLCDLVFVWSKLHSRLKTSNPDLLEESRQLMLSATNVKSIFPFIKVILQELGEDGIQFCVELCANALQSCLPCDIVTKSLIYKTIAGLLPSDLEVCRACALLVFFLERTVEAYKMVYVLYMHPDQEYHVEHSPIRNHIRFETLQVLKKDLYFDPEFWNLIALRTNCLKLMSEKVVGAALEEIMEEKWVSNYCAKEIACGSSASRGQKRHKGAHQEVVRKRHHKERTLKEDSSDVAAKRLKVGQGKTRLNVAHAVKRKGNQGSRYMKEASSEPLRRSYWQLDRIHDRVASEYEQQRRTTRLSEKNPPKRRIRKPKWLLEDSGTAENNVPSRIKKHGLKNQKDHQSAVVNRSHSGHIKNNSKHKVSANSHLKTWENNTSHQKGVSLDCHKPDSTPQVILELSLPDNELMGTFTEDTCNRQRGYPQMLLYKPTVKLPATSQPIKTVHGKEVVLRARDATMFVQQLHCYARRQKGKGNGSNIHGSVSTITRSSAQGSPPKEPHGDLCEKPDAETKGQIGSQTPAPLTESPVLDQSTVAGAQKTAAARERLEKSVLEMKVSVPSQTSDVAKVTETPIFDKAPQSHPTEKISQTISPAMELCEEPAVEMKVTIASQTPAVAKMIQPSATDKASRGQTTEDDSQTTAVIDRISPVTSTANISNTGAPRQMPSLSQDVVFKDGGALVNKDGEQVMSLFSQSENGEKCRDELKDVKRDNTFGENMGAPCEMSETEVSRASTESNSLNDLSALTLVTEVVSEFTPVGRDLENSKLPASEASPSKESTLLLVGKLNVPLKMESTSNSSAPHQGASVVADVQGIKEEEEIYDDDDPETSENSNSMEPTVESEESKLEFCCTFCDKVFKGNRVVPHAMFHFRKDECMFCGTMFEDDLRAMMHMSDHIEKLKKSKESVGKGAQENQVSDTKDISTLKTPAKAKITNMSSGHRSSARLRKSSVCPASPSHPDPEACPSASKKLKSNEKSVGQFVQKKKQLQQLRSKSPVHKVNGHIGKKKHVKTKKDTSTSEAKQKSARQELKTDPDRANVGSANPALPETSDAGGDSAPTCIREERDFGCSSEEKKQTESSHFLKSIGKVVEERTSEPLEKLHCPADGCTWFTDLSKNRVALLYHALEDHYGDVKPLELSFQVGNSRCSICMRVLWSFEHFQHHVERHRLTPRHPCLHQGCTARFKTGMEMRRHARRHSPLQAVCCVPGCSQLFICLWALNLHEKEHYAAKPTKPAKNTNEQTGHKHNNTQAEKKHEDATVKKTVKTARKLRRQLSRDLSTEKNACVPPLSTVKASVVKQELRLRNVSKDSNVLKNLSNKDTTAQPAAPRLRLKQTLRKGQLTRTNLTAPKTHKVFSSSLLKRNGNVRHKFKTKQVKGKKRGRPPKSKKAVHDENITTERNCETVEDRTAQHRTDPPETADGPTVSNKIEVEAKSQQDEVSMTETSSHESKPKKLGNKIQSDHVQQKALLHDSATCAHADTQLTTTTSAGKTQEATAHKVKAVHSVKKRCAPEENSQNGSIKAKKHKTKNMKVEAKIVKKKGPRKEPDVTASSKTSAKSKSMNLEVEAKTTVAVESSADKEGKSKVENAESTLNRLGDPVATVEASSLNAPITPEKTKHKITEKSRKSHTLKKSHSSKERNTASSNSGKASKQKVNRHKGDEKTGTVRQQGKHPVKTSVSKYVAQSVEAKAAEAADGPDGDGKAEQETSAATPGSPVSTMHVVTTSEQKIQKETKSKQSHVRKNSSKAVKAPKKDGKMKTEKKARPHKDKGVRSAPGTPSKTAVPQVAEAKAEEVASSAGEGRALEKTSKARYAVVVNGKSAKEDEKSTLCMDTLAEYGKRPYMRLPPTVYLDERYTTMPKRRKELSSLQSSQKSPPPEQARVTPALQRQRCANCFATFSSAEELQSHQQLKRCSNFFGFDSDEEGNG